MGLSSVAPAAWWAGFGALVLVLLALDLGVFHRRERVVAPREALAWSGFWISLALLFGLGVFLRFGAERGEEFLAVAVAASRFPRRATPAPALDAAAGPVRGGEARREAA